MNACTTRPDQPRPRTDARPAVATSSARAPRSTGEAARDLHRSIPHYYDLEYADWAGDIGLYQRLAFETGDPTLELGCGTGRVAIPLARTGSRVVGLDADHDMLALCRAKRDRLAGTLRGRLDLVRADMRRFALGDEFRFVFVAFNTFLLLSTPAERDACLTCVREHLADDGQFVVDVFLPDPARLARPETDEVFERAFYWAGGRTTVMKYSRARANVARQQMNVEFQYRYHDAAGRPQADRRCLRMALVFPNEMRLLLERNGFAVKDVYGSYDMEPLNRSGDRMVFVAGKA